VDTVKEAGYVYVYLSNDGEEVREVYFDDFKVEHVKSPVVQSQDYFPFRLTFNSYQRENALNNHYQYNGKEMQDELSLGWLDYGARMYRPDIGRWSVVDPLGAKMKQHSVYNYAFDNPIRYIDPDGRDPREGNEVITIDYKKHFITDQPEKGEEGSIQDGTLYWNATKAVFNSAGPIGGRPGNIVDKFDKVDNVFGYDPKVRDNAHTWQGAAKRKTGYDFVQLNDDGSSTHRRVTNLNEAFGVESGYENVVTNRTEKDKDGKVTGVSTTRWPR
jgi:RHS repeat-associated protein